MKLLIGLFFVVIALILLGVLWISRDIFKNKPGNSAENYWALALALDTAGLFMFGVYMATAEDFNQLTLMGTLGNTAMLAAYIYQTLNIRSLRKDISPRSKLFTLGVVVCLGVVWHVGKHYSTPQLRSFLMATVAAGMLVWQLFEIHACRHDLMPSAPMRTLFHLVMAELLMTLVRALAFADLTPLLHVEEVPLLVMVVIWVQMGLKVLTYAVIKGYWQDVTVQEQARTHLENTQFKALNARQEKLIADLGRLNKATTAGVLAASVAHELNQPLQATSLNIEMLEQMLSAQPPDVAAARAMLKHQQEDLARMALIVSTMRGVFSESGALPQTIDLFVLLKNLDLLLSAQAHKHGIRIDYLQQGDTKIHVRVSELQQVALNIFGNAFDALIAHQTPHPCIRVTVSQVDSEVIAHIEDNGPGVEPALQGEVFNILRTTKSEGMGLGLWLARYITERNDGRISLSTSDLGGARLSLHFAHAA